MHHRDQSRRWHGLIRWDGKGTSPPPTQDALVLRKASDKTSEQDILQTACLPSRNHQRSHGKQGQSETRHSRKEPRGPDGSGHVGSRDSKSVFGKNGGNLDKRWTSVNKNVQNWLISITKVPS